MLAGVTVYQEHGPLLFFTMVLILAGLQLVCLGLLGEIHVRHFHLGGVGRRDSGVLRVVRKQ